MNCPIGGSVLLVAHRSGIEIDICPTCRGVWLDRGELNKLITLASDRAAPHRPPSIHPFGRKTTRSARHALAAAPSGELVGRRVRGHDPHR